MAHYHKRPIVIEVDATQFWPEMLPWPVGVQQDSTAHSGYGIWAIDHIWRRHEVTPGDWIVHGVHGEVYVMKDAIFRETYEFAEESTF